MSTTTDDLIRFSVGTQWKIKDLTSEAGKKFNGKTCVVVSKFDVASGRVGVRTTDARKGGRTLNIKPINLHDNQSTTQMKGLKKTTPQEAQDGEDCPQEAEDKEDCPICTDALPKLSIEFVRLTLLFAFGIFIIVMIGGAFKRFLLPSFSFVIARK
jgi:hypothetical protein